MHWWNVGKTVMMGRRGGGVGEVEGKQISDGNPDVSHHHSPDREASMDVKPKRRGTTDTDGEKMSEKRQFCDRNISPHPDVSELRFVDSARHTSVNILNV